MKLRDTEDFEDMLTALLETRRQIVERKEPFTDADDPSRELLLYISTAEINLLTWTMGVNDHANDFMRLNVCDLCGDLGEYSTEVNDVYTTYDCNCRQQPGAGGN